MTCPPSSVTSKSQVEGGADVLDVNMGVPLVDEAELLAKVVTMIQSLTDLPLCIDSSVVEALEAGLSAYNGRALVNSITAEDERMEQILPLVKKYDAAVIALPNDVDEIPMEPDKRLALVEKIVRVATTEYGIAIEDIVIDPLAMPIGADVTNGLATLETMRRIRDTYGLNMTCGASNVSFGMPGRHELNGTFLSMAMTAGLTSAIMDTRTPAVVSAVKATDLLLGHDEWGMAWISRHRAAQAAAQARGAGRERVDSSRWRAPEPPSLGNIGREGLMAPPGTTPVAPRRHRPGAAVVHRRGWAGPRRPGATRRDRLRLGVVERHRDRLDLWWPRHLPQVQGPGRHAPCRSRATTAGRSRRPSSPGAGGWPAWPPRRRT